MNALDLRVEALRRDFAAVFDGPGLGLIESLLARAATLGGEAGARLSARASLRIGALESALAMATAEVTRELEAMSDATGDAAGDATGDAAADAADATMHAGLAAAREALARGDRRGARRALRRARAESARARERVGVAWVARLAGEATLRGEDRLGRELTALCRDGALDRSAHAHAVALGSTLSSALFRRSAERARATVALARSADNLPDNAGRYNSQVVAIRALAAMAELSPDYASVVIAALDDLAAVEALLGPSPAAAVDARRVRKRRPDRSPR